MSLVDYEKAMLAAAVSGSFGRPSRLHRSVGPKLSVSCILVTMMLLRPQFWNGLRWFSLETIQRTDREANNYPEQLQYSSISSDRCFSLSTDSLLRSPFYLSPFYSSWPKSWISSTCLRSIQSACAWYFHRYYGLLLHLGFMQVLLPQDTHWSLCSLPDDFDRYARFSWRWYGQGTQHRGRKRVQRHCEKKLLEAVRLDVFVDWRQHRRCNDQLFLDTSTYSITMGTKSKETAEIFRRRSGLSSMRCWGDRASSPSY